MLVRSSTLAFSFLIALYAGRAFGDDIVQETSAERQATGTIVNKRHESFTQNTRSGGSFFFLRSHRPRIASVKTYTGEVVHPKDDRHQNFEHDLHTAYRLPLQRLSNEQLYLILKKYSNETNENRVLSRNEMINRVQHKIVQQADRRLLRPTLLTNVNVLADDLLDVHSSTDSLAPERTTVSGLGVTPLPKIRAALARQLTGKQKAIPLETEISSKIYVDSETDYNNRERFGGVTRTKPKEITAVDAGKSQNLQKLHELNQRKLNLANPHPHAKKTIHTTHHLVSVVDNDPPAEDEEPITLPPTKPLLSKSLISSMADGLRQILHFGREIEHHHHHVPHDNGFTPGPRAVPIPRTFASKSNIQNHRRPGFVAPTPVRAVPLHDGGNDDEELPLKGHGSSLSIGMTRVGSAEVSTEDLIRDLVKEEAEILSTTASTQAPIPTTIAELEPAAQIFFAETEETEASTSTPITLEDFTQSSTTSLAEEESTLPPSTSVTWEDSTQPPSTSETWEESTQPPSTSETWEESTQPLSTSVTWEESTQPSSLPPDAFEPLTQSIFEQNGEALTTINGDDDTTIIFNPTTAFEPVYIPTTEAAPTTEEAEEVEEETVSLVESVDDKLTDADICDAVACDFEKGDLCQWQTSIDEVSPDSRHYRRHRSVHYLRRAWHNWEGRYRNRITGIARAQVFSFDNKRFVASYVRPNQRSTLTANLLSLDEETIHFRVWEATRDLQLRVCCDSTSTCVYETETGVYRGSRRWREATATCPRGTTKIIFECINNGIYQGACGLDNIYLKNSYCPEVIPGVQLHDSELRRRRIMH